MVAFPSTAYELGVVATSVDDAVVVLFKAKFDTVPVTVIVEVAVLLPSCVVTVIVALPAATAVANPLVLMVATAVLLELYVTVLLVAFVGAIIEEYSCVAPIARDVLDGVIVMPVTGTLAAVTVIVEVAVLLPSWVVTVIVALPVEIAVIRPVAFTVATAVLLEVQLTVLLVALAGAIVAVSCWVEPTTLEADVGVTVTPVTGTFAATTVIVEVAVLLPS